MSKLAAILAIITIVLIAWVLVSRDRMRESLMEQSATPTETSLENTGNSE